MSDTKSLDDLIESLNTFNDALEKMDLEAMESVATVDTSMRKTGPEEIEDFVQNLTNLGYSDMAEYFKTTYEEAKLPMKKFFEFMCTQSNDVRRATT